MRAPSASISALCKRLFAALSAADLDDATAALAALSARGEPTALPSLLGLLLHPAPAVAAAAKGAAAAILAATAPSDLGWLELRLRLRSDTYSLGAGDGAASWRCLRTGEVPVLASGPAAAALLFFASCHGDGHVREAAVHALAARCDGSEVAPLLLRRNDWVLPVRAAAADALLARLTVDHAGALARNLPLLDALSAQRRGHHGPYCEKVRELLRSAAAAPALSAVLLAPDRRLRRAAYRLAVDSAGLPLRPLLQQAMADSDLVVRLWAARTARARLYGPALREALGQARGDRAAPVRREVLAAFLDDYPELSRALLDPAAGLRHMARHYLSKKVHIDYGALYREALAAPEGRVRAAAAAALGEVGREGDAEALLPLCQEGPVRVRKAALRALGRIGGEAHGAVLIAARDSGEAGVRRAALEALGTLVPKVKDPDIARSVLAALRR